MADGWGGVYKQTPCTTMDATQYGYLGTEAERGGWNGMGRTEKKGGPSRLRRGQVQWQ